MIGERSTDARAGLGPLEAAAYAREFAGVVATRERRQRRRLLARRIAAAWRAWKTAGALDAP